MMTLTKIVTNDLLTQIKSLVHREKEITLEILDYLSEVSRRKAYLPKHTSLFGYLVDELGYCPSTAQLRLNSLKALQTLPEIRQSVRISNSKRKWVFRDDPKSRHK